MPSKHLLSRRTCLRGVGATLALPLLDSMGWAEPGVRAAKPPVRLGFMYMPHGVIMDQFWPQSPETFLTEPPPAIESLRPVLNRCLMMNGISAIPFAPFGAAHALELSTWLTAKVPNPNRRTRIDIGVSADQIAANYVGSFTALPSLELATMPQTHMEHQDGLHEAYYSHCSFSSPTQPLPAEINPRNVLKRLFGQSDRPGQPGRTGPLDRQMLDLVLGGARDLRKRLPKTDQEKLDEYLDSVRSIERRIAAIEQQQQEAALAKADMSKAKLRSVASPPMEITIPDDAKYGKGGRRIAYMQIMCDLNVLAFQADVTRVSTYIGSTPDGVSYPELGFNDEHHSQTHHSNQPEMMAKVAAITEFNITQFAHMVKKMASLREGDGMLLDNCIMMWGSGLEDGSLHTRENLPFILAGNGGGSLKTGRFLTGIKGNQGDLLTTLLACMGVPLDRPLGMANGLIPEIMSA